MNLFAGRNRKALDAILRRIAAKAVDPVRREILDTPEKVAAYQSESGESAQLGDTVLYREIPKFKV